MNSTRLLITDLVTAGSVIGFPLLALTVISRIAKYVIQKYDQKYQGCKITLNFAYFNPFTITFI